MRETCRVPTFTAAVGVSKISSVPRSVSYTVTAPVAPGSIPAMRILCRPDYFGFLSMYRACLAGPIHTKYALIGHCHQYTIFAHSLGTCFRSRTARLEYSEHKTERK